MRRFIRMMLVAATVVSLTGAAVSAQEAKRSKLFPEPPLGLGADIPDDLLFNGDESDDQTNSSASADRPAAGSNWQTDVQPAPSNDEVLPWLNRTTGACLDRSVVMRRLARDGWHDFHRLSLRPRTLAFNARRGRGSLRRLQVDRCSGRIIHESAAYID
ncbi:MAG: hypothetical protein ACR2O4_13455 [Hyphomicrobiaceae bacterium]